MSDIRHRVLSALALNRTPGFSFTGYFLGLRFDHVDAGQARISLAPGPFCEDADGRVPISVLAVLADVALGTVVRANLTPEQRLGTVSLHLQLNGERCAGPLSAVGTFEGFLHGTLARQGLGRVCLAAGGHPILSGHGAFMVLDPPPGVTMHPIVGAEHGAVAPVDVAGLDDHERAILERAEAALAAADTQRSFIQRFWEIDARASGDGAVCQINNGPHIGNRVGHMQGGLQVGLAASTAMAALPRDWMLSAISATFVSPGEDRILEARSQVVHQGERTAVLRTVITGKSGRRVLDTLSTHARLSG